jgi:osmotically inducible protein OsmC
MTQSSIETSEFLTCYNGGKLLANFSKFAKKEDIEMAVRRAEARWEGGLKDGKGVMKFGDGFFEGPYTWSSRFEEESGTNPEELIGAALAGCFSMAFSGDLGKAGFNPRSIQTQAQVHLDRIEGKARITRIQLETEAEVPEISNEQFQEIAEGAKQGCPVSTALGSVEITLEARLV